MTEYKRLMMKMQRNVLALMSAQLMLSAAKTKNQELIDKAEDLTVTSYELLEEVNRFLGD